MIKDGKDIDDPLEADSGGVIDLAAFALRLSCLMLAKPKLRRIIILDEPFKYVSEQYIPNIRKLIEGLAEDFKVQFIIVTHIKELRIGKIIEL